MDKKVEKKVGVTQKDIRLLLVDDEGEFRSAACRALACQGFGVIEAENGEAALSMIRSSPPDLVVLDLNMKMGDGVSTLQEIRKTMPELPVIILTGQGRIDDAMNGVRLQVVDFLQKPVDMEILGGKIRQSVTQRISKPLREKTLQELMVPGSSFPKCYSDQTLEEVLQTIRELSSVPTQSNISSRIQPAILVFDRREKFAGLLSAKQVLKLMTPPFAQMSLYPLKRAGMFLAQSKLVGKTKIGDLLNNHITVQFDAPLIAVVHLMVNEHLCQMPVMKHGELFGIIQEQDIFEEFTELVLGRRLDA